MKPQDFDNVTFTPQEVDCAWHIYAAMLSYSMGCPASMDNPRFAAAVEQQKFMFDRMFERLER